MTVAKRKREPEVSGMRRYPFRTPGAGTRWKALLDAIEYDPTLSDKDRAQSILDFQASIEAKGVKARCVKHGLDPAEPFVAELVEAKAQSNVDTFALGLEALVAERAERNAQRNGAPPNDPMLELIAFALVRQEMRAATEAGKEFRITDLAEALGIHHDALKRGFAAGQEDCFYGLRGLSDPSEKVAEAARDFALVWNFVTNAVATHWPAIAARKNPRE